MEKIIISSSMSMCKGLIIHEEENNINEKDNTNNDSDDED